MSGGSLAPPALFGADTHLLSPHSRIDIQLKIALTM
jgi:hypothetical protein